MPFTHRGFDIKAGASIHRVVGSGEM